MAGSRRFRNTHADSPDTVEDHAAIANQRGSQKNAHDAAEQRRLGNDAIADELEADAVADAARAANWRSGQAPSYLDLEKAIGEPPPDRLPRTAVDSLMSLGEAKESTRSDIGL